jgi:hypothetical protein
MCLLPIGIVLVSLQRCMWYTRSRYPYFGIHFPLYSRLVSADCNCASPTPCNCHHDLFFCFFNVKIGKLLITLSITVLSVAGEVIYALWEE